MDETRTSTLGPLRWNGWLRDNAIRDARKLTEAQRVALKRSVYDPSSRVWAARQSTEDALHVRGIVKLDDTRSAGWGGCRVFRLTDHGRRVVALLAAEDRALGRAYWHAQDYPPDFAIATLDH